MSSPGDVTGLLAEIRSGSTRAEAELIPLVYGELGGLAKIHDNGQQIAGVLESFYPATIQAAQIPINVPQGIVAEYREAELCASAGAWRAASALLRSTLEKTLKANGYGQGVLQKKIDQAAADGIITEARRQRAHDEVRVLGNDVLHDDWRQVTSSEFGLAHHYVTAYPRRLL